MHIYMYVFILLITSELITAKKIITGENVINLVFMILQT